MVTKIFYDYKNDSWSFCLLFAGGGRLCGHGYETMQAAWEASDYGITKDQGNQ